MAGKALCKIPDCANTSFGKGMCRLHFQRWKRTGRTDVTLAPRGAPMRFLRAALESETAKCIFWPYAKHRKGFGLIMHEGKTRVAARVVCEMLHGAPASRELQAAHSCGNGHLACVNPRHLRWATNCENAADQLIHGTRVRGQKVRTTILSETEVLEIRTLFGSMTDASIAERYGVAPGTIRSIRTGRNWSWLISDQPPSEPPQSLHSSE